MATEVLAKKLAPYWADFLNLYDQDPVYVWSGVTATLAVIGLVMVILLPELQLRLKRRARRRRGMEIHRARKAQLKAMLADDVAAAVWNRFHAGEMGWQEGEWPCSLIGDCLTIRDLVPRNRDTLKEAIRKRLAAAGKLPAHLKTDAVTEGEPVEGKKSKLQDFMTSIRAAS